MPVSGRPAPLIRWTKENSPTLDENANVDTADYSSTFSILSCTKYNAGKYLLKLENACGLFEASCVIKVLDTPGPVQNLTVCNYYLSTTLINILMYMMYNNRFKKYAANMLF